MAGSGNRFERILGVFGIDRTQPIVTMVFLAACVSLYIVTAQQSMDPTGDGPGMFGPQPTGRVLLRYGASNPVLIQHADQWWRLVTANFLHGSLAHLVFNGMALWVIGKTVEHTFGRLRTFTLFLVTGTLGHAASYAWRVYRHDMIGSVGASAAVFGLLGCIVVYARRHPGGAGRELRAQFVPWLVFSLIMGFAIPNVDHAAHIGGLAAGALFGWGLGDLRQARRAPDWFWGVVAACLLAVTALCFARAAMTPNPLLDLIG